MGLLAARIMPILLRPTLLRCVSRGGLRAWAFVFGSKCLFGINRRMRLEGHPDIFQAWISLVSEEISSGNFYNGPEKNKTGQHQSNIRYRRRSHSPDPLNYLVLLSMNATIVACLSGHRQAIPALIAKQPEYIDNLEFIT
jgi:hypothetical protein